MNIKPVETRKVGVQRIINNLQQNFVISEINLYTIHTLKLLDFNLYNTNRQIDFSNELFSQWYPPDDGFVFPGDNNLIFTELNLFF